MSARNSVSEEENIPTVLSDKALEEANNYIKEAFGILQRETNKVRKEKEAFDEVAKKLEHVHFSKMLKLNVGGHIFSTSLATLTKDPGSMLNAMFSGRFDTKANEDGSYFIDRDGTHFRYILNYLRTGQFIVPEENIFRRELLAEAEFYQIEGIINELTARPFKNSVILSPDQRQTLFNWLKETRVFTNTIDNLVFGLIYRASRNGWDAEDFHRCCDYKGPTVTVIKSGKYIFGGYTEAQWEPTVSGRYMTATEPFLFSLVNPSGLPPTKMPLIAGKEENAIYCHNGYGPIFGGGHDLIIRSGPNTNNSSVSLNSSYQCPTGEDSTTFLTGNKDFKIDEMEVFGFEK